MSELISHLKNYIRFCSKNELSTASAALSYYLTLTFFPMIICFYYLLGSNYDKASYILSFSNRLLPDNTAVVLHEFLKYVSENCSGPMFATGLAVLVSTSSAAVRSLQSVIGKMQGGQRFQGFKDVVFSVCFSLAFIAAMYFSVIVLLTGDNFLKFLERILPFAFFSGAWRYMRFFLMAFIELIIINGIYTVSKRENDNYSTASGAAFASFAMVAVSLFFSFFIGVSAKYPLVYGSLAAIILLMFWLYLCCFVIYMGAALNIMVNNVKTSR